MEAIARRSARAVLIDDDGHLVLIRRTKPGQQPYWTTAGGGVEPGDASREAAAEREVAEEIGGRVIVGPQVFLSTLIDDWGMTVQHYFLSRLIDVDPALRTGPEHNDPARGLYELERFPLSEVADIDLRPVELRAFIISNAAALLADLPRQTPGPGSTTPSPGYTA